MAASNLIAIGKTAATSSNVVLADGANGVISLKVTNGGRVPAGAIAFVDILDDTGNFTETAILSNSQPSVIARGPATYRARRPVQDADGGVFLG